MNTRINYFLVFRISGSNKMLKKYQNPLRDGRKSSKEGQYEFSKRICIAPVSGLLQRGKVDRLKMKLLETIKLQKLQN